MKPSRHLPLIAAAVTILGLAAYSFGDGGGDDHGGHHGDGGNGGGYYNDGYGGYTTGTPVQGQQTPVPTVTPTVSPSPSSSPSTVAIATATGSIGTYLINGTARALYVYSADTSDVSNCTGSCLAAWPAFAGTAAVAGPNVNQSLISAFIRTDDGASQITYNGLPLYTFTGDTAAGQTNGEGVTVGSGTFYLVDVNGNPITGASPSPSPSPSASASASATDGTTGSGY